MLGKAFFLVPDNSRPPKGTGGRAPKKNSETARKRSAGAADDQDFSKIARSKKNAIFAPLKTNGRADGNQKERKKERKIRKIHQDVFTRPREEAAGKGGLSETAPQASRTGSTTLSRTEYGKAATSSSSRCLGFLRQMTLTSTVGSSTTMTTTTW